MAVIVTAISDAQDATMIVIITFLILIIISIVRVCAPVRELVFVGCWWLPVTGPEQSPALQSIVSVVAVVVVAIIVAAVVGLVFLCFVVFAVVVTGKYKTKTARDIKSKCCLSGLGQHIYHEPVIQIRLNKAVTSHPNIRFQVLASTYIKGSQHPTIIHGPVSQHM